MLDANTLTAAQKAATDQLITDITHSVEVDGETYPAARCSRYGATTRDWVAGSETAKHECNACPVQAACIVKTLRREAAGATGPTFRAGFTPEQRDRLSPARDAGLWQAINRLPQ